MDYQTLIMALANRGGGTPGVSPTIAVTEITGGHRVTITDAEHPNGQTFDVMDGQGGGSSAVIDDTLTQQGQAADAKAVGDTLKYTSGEIAAGIDGISYDADSGDIAAIYPLNGQTTTMDVWMCGKNILEPSMFQTGMGLYDDGHTEAASKSICSQLLPLSLDVGTNFYLQFSSALCQTNGAARFCFYNAAKTFISYKGEWYWSGKTAVLSVSIPANAKYFRFALQNMYDQTSTAADFLANNTVMLAYGTASSTYAAYTGSHVTFSVAQQNVENISAPAGGQIILPEDCDVTFGVVKQAETVSEIIENAPVNAAFKVSKKVNGAFVGAPEDIAGRFVTSRKTGTSVSIADALECKVISCVCNSDVTVKGTNLLPCGSITFTDKSPWYELDEDMISGDYTLTLSASSDTVSVASFTMILSSSTSESAAQAAGLLAYRTVPINSGTYSVRISSNGAHRYVRFYCATSTAAISVIAPMFVKGYDGENVPYQKYLKPRSYAPNELYLKDQPITLTANGAGIDVTYIVKTDYVGTLMFGVSGGVVSSGENIVTPEEYGAVGDGVTDDSAAIQAAIDTGAKIINMHGNYNLGTTGIVFSGSGLRVNCLGTLTYTGSGAAVKVYGCVNCKFVFDTIISSNDCLWITVDSQTNSYYCDYDFSLFSAGPSGACIKLTRTEFSLSDQTGKGTLSEQRFHGGQLSSGGWGIYADLLYDDNLDKYPGNGWFNEGSYKFYDIGFELVGWGAELHSIGSAMFIGCRTAEQGQTSKFNTNGVMKTVGLCNNLVWIGYDGLSGDLSDTTYGICCRGTDMQMSVYSVIFCGRVIPLQKMYNIPAQTAPGTGKAYVSNGVFDMHLCCSSQSREPVYVNTMLRESDAARTPSSIELNAGTYGLIVPYYYGRVDHQFGARDIYTEHYGFVNDLTVFYKNGTSADHLTVWQKKKDGSYTSVVNIPAGDVDFSKYGVRLHYGGGVENWTYDTFSLNPAATVAVPFYVNEIYDREISVLYDTEPVLRIGTTKSGAAYQWQISTDSGVTWSDISGETGDSYTPELTAGMVGYQYRCRASYDGVTIDAEPTTIVDTNIGPSRHAQASPNVNAG